MVTTERSCWLPLPCLNELLTVLGLHICSVYTPCMHLNDLWTKTCVMKLKSVRTGEGRQNCSLISRPMLTFSTYRKQQNVDWEQGYADCSSNQREHNQQNCSGVLLQYNNSDLELLDILAMQNLHIKYSCKMNTIILTVWYSPAWTIHNQRGWNENLPRPKSP